MQILCLSHKAFYREYIYPKLQGLKNFHSFFYYVLFLILIGFGFFFFALITQCFTTPFTGDYSQQGIPFAFNFYDTWWTFFKTLNFPNWDHNVFLGADNIEANTFYGVFSPFTFPILFLPREMIAQSMALMSIARMVVGGLLFRLYLKTFNVKESTARIFSLAYAFMGWTAYHLWFNSFYEVATFFPLILYGIERVLKDKIIWSVSLGFFLLGISNYFFFLTAGIFGVIYALFRYLQTIKQRHGIEHLTVILLGIAGFALGILMSGFCTLPAIISSFNIARYENSTYWSDIVYAFENDKYKEAFKYIFLYWDGDNNGYRSFYPLASFLFPTISNRFVTVVRDIYFDNFGSSIFIFTPSIIMLFSSLYISFKERKPSHFIAATLLTLSLFIPFLYYLCGAMSIGYGRWEIIVPLCALAYVAIQFDKREMLKRWVIIVSGVITSILMVLAYLYGQYLETKFIRVDNYSGIIFLLIYEVVVAIVTTALLAKYYKDVKINKIITGIISVEIIVMGTIIANVHGLSNYLNSASGGFSSIRIESDIVNKITAIDQSFYRIQSNRAYSGNDNIMMIENYNGASTFHSFYNTEVDDFQRMSHILKSDNTWIGSASEKRINLDAFLGVKYYLQMEEYFDYSYQENNEWITAHLPINVPLGYTRIDNASDGDGYALYRNDHHINFASSYKTIYDKGNCASSIYNNFHSGSHLTDVMRNEEAYLKGAILNSEDAFLLRQKYGDIFTYENAPKREMKHYQEPTSVSFYHYKDIFNPTKPNLYLESGTKISSSDLANYKKTELLIEFKPTYEETFPMSEEGMYYLIYYPITSKTAIDIFFISEDENGQSYVSLFDRYMNTDSDGYKYLRGFYPTIPVTKILMRPRGDEVRTNVSLYYEDIATTLNRIDNLRQYSVYNVIQDVDYFSFESNYDSIRFMITQVAYSKNWQVKAKDDNGNIYHLNTYNSQGGFVGFVTPSDGHLVYEMTYITPLYQEGLIISLVATAILISGSIIIFFYQKRKLSNKN